MRKRDLLTWPLKWLTWNFVYVSKSHNTSNSCHSRVKQLSRTEKTNHATQEKKWKLTIFNTPKPNMVAHSRLVGPETSCFVDYAYEFLSSWMPPEGSKILLRRECFFFVIFPICLYSYFSFKWSEHLILYKFKTNRGSVQTKWLVSQIPSFVKSDIGNRRQEKLNCNLHKENIVNEVLNISSVFTLGKKQIHKVYKFISNSFTSIQFIYYINKKYLLITTCFPWILFLYFINSRLSKRFNF